LLAKMKAVLDSEGWVAIDAPFGFPHEFSKQLRSWVSDGRTKPWPKEDQLTWRETERFVSQQLKQLQAGSRPWPLSVVVEKITPTAMRCAHLLSELNSGRPVDRIGFSSRIVETYPVAALRLWGSRQRHRRM